MPTYVYRCLHCEIEVEAQRKMNQADEPLECPLSPGDRMHWATIEQRENNDRLASMPVYGIGDTSLTGR
ncbi:MAG TPA: hypothetical protein PLD25_09970 [Chloroflexota bacterium]|nr:hypothetical protein [Chloroflexota bacterium]HUM72483.1 hypothetical protein [Chloroflexota bacterium]